MKSLTNAIDHRQGNDLITPAGKFRFYSDFVQRYGATPYAERAYRKLCNLYPPDVPELSDSLHQHYLRDFIMRFPDSDFLEGAIPKLKAEFVPREQRTASFESCELIWAACGRRSYDRS